MKEFVVAQSKHTLLVVAHHGGATLCYPEH
jgi:hypothetical protein